MRTGRPWRRTAPYDAPVAYERCGAQQATRANGRRRVLKTREQAGERPRRTRARLQLSQPRLRASAAPPWRRCAEQVARRRGPHGQMPQPRARVDFAGRKWRAGCEPQLVTCNNVPKRGSGLHNRSSVQRRTTPKGDPASVERYLCRQTVGSSA